MIVSAAYQRMQTAVKMLDNTRRKQCDATIFFNILESLFCKIKGKIKETKEVIAKEQPTNKSSRPRGQRSKTISHLKIIVAKTCSLRIQNNLRRFQKSQNQDMPCLQIYKIKYIKLRANCI